MTWIVGAALLVTLCLVAWRRLFVVFGVYLALELVKWWLYREGGTAVYLAWEPWVLAFRVAAAIEAWVLVTWMMPEPERRALLAGSVGTGLAAMYIVWWAWPLIGPAYTLNQIRLLAHVGSAGALLTAVCWLLFHAVRPWGFFNWHSLTLTLYLGLFSWAGLQRAATEAGWNEVRLIFRCGLILLLLVFSGQQFFQRRNASLKSCDFMAQ